MVKAMHIAKHYYGIKDPNNLASVRKGARQFLRSELYMHGPPTMVQSLVV